MLKNYFLIAFRSMKKQKAFTLVHVLGLGLAFAASILLYLTAQHEWSYDQFHERKERIGLVYQSHISASGPKHQENHSAPLAAVLKADMPSVEKSSRYGHAGLVFRHGDKEISSTVRFVDPDFFSIFSFEAKNGDLSSALKDLDGVVLSANMADKLFGHQDIVGESIAYKKEDQWVNGVVTAVLDEIPETSSLTISAAMRFEQMPGYDHFKDQWNHNNHAVFVLWKGDKIDPQAFQTQSRAVVSTYFQTLSEEYKSEGALANEDGSYMSINVLPFEDYHINDLHLGSGVPPFYPFILILLAGLILFIASANFINLTIAGSFSRSKEIGMRKTMGSRTWQLVLQLWMESVGICLLAFAVGICFTWVLLPVYNANMKYQLQLQDMLSAQNLAVILLGFFAIALLAGGYPAWKISRAGTIETLKGKFVSGKSSPVRTVLTVVQFTIAIVLISATLIVHHQLLYLKNQPLGYDQTEVISIPIGNDIDKEAALQRMRVALKDHPEVLYVSGADLNLGRGEDQRMGTSRISFTHEDQVVRTNWLRVDYDYLATLGLTLVAGRDFSPSFGTDSLGVLINEKMAAQLGGPEKALNQRLPLSQPGLTVIGVVKDYHFQSLRNAIEPLTLFIHPQFSNLEYLFVRVQTQRLDQTLASVQNIWKEINPKATVAATYLDQNTQNLYERDQRFGNMIIGASILAIGIACMGLFAISLLMINRRIKEIGIRKILGSSVLKIVWLLSQDIVRWILLAFFIGAPLAWWGGQKWLASFAYRDELDWGLLAFAGGLVLLVSLVTILFHSIRAALANPVESLRDE